MTSEHTPGPWTCSKLEDDDYPFCYNVKSLDCTLAYVAGFDDDEEEGEANACLIHAAPDLLEALELAFNYFKRMQAIFDGESRTVQDDVLDDLFDKFIEVAPKAIAKARGKVDE